MFSHRFLLVILKSRSLDFTSLSLSVVVIFVALTDLYQSRFVYHLKRRRSPRKLVKYIIVCKCSGFCPKQQKTKQIEKYQFYQEGYSLKESPSQGKNLRIVFLLIAKAHHE